jgi:hypothetical protein
MIGLFFALLWSKCLTCSKLVGEFHNEVYRSRRILSKRITFTQCTFTGCRVARPEVHGGAIFAKASMVLGITGCVFSRCSAHPEDWRAGGVLCASRSFEVSINRSIANDSSANATGGFGHIRLSSNGPVPITFMAISMNKIAEAALAVTWSGVAISYANLTSNNASDSGSGFRAERQGALIVRSTVLSENKKGNLIYVGVGIEARNLSCLAIVRNQVACTMWARAGCTWIRRRSPSPSLERTGSMYSPAAPPR